MTVENALELLANRTRRRTLRHLAEADGGAVELDDLLDGITAGDPLIEPTDERTDDELRIGMRHVHLPKLAEAGVVEYDARTDVVRYCPSGMIERLLSVVTDERRDPPA